MALISGIQSGAVCSAFCNVTLGLANHAMFNVADGTLSILFRTLCGCDVIVRVGGWHNNERLIFGMGQDVSNVPCFREIFLNRYPFFGG